MDCLHAVAYPKRAYDGIALEELLCSAARSVAVATDAADMPQVVWSLLDAMCKFVDEERLADFFMIGGDVNGSWKPA